LDLAAVFLLSLLGGYNFASVWRVTAFRTRRMEGHHLYFRAALYGAMLFAVALIIRWLLSLVWSAYQPLESELIRYISPLLKEEVGVRLDEQTRRAEWVITAVYSLILGILSGALLNIFTPRRWALLRSVGAFDALFLRAQADDLPVQLTLSSGKVYIGIVVSTADPMREPVVVSIIPMFSGFRDPEGRMTLTTDYDTVYSNLKMGRAAQLGLPAHWLSEFELIVRADEIVTATLFSPMVYADFNPDWKQRIARQSKSP
jgi:hypothetical protein